MLSAFFPEYPSTKAIPKNSAPADLNFKTYDLSDEKILYLSINGNDERTLKTKLKIYFIHKLNDCIAEKEFEGRFNLSCIFPDGSILIKTKLQENTGILIKLSTQLEVVSSQKWKDSTCEVAIDNNTFFAFSNNSNVSLIRLYQWNQNCFEKFKICKIPYVSPINFAKSIGVNRYCAQIGGYAKLSTEFKILIFEINPDTYDIKMVDIIAPKVQHSYGNFQILPNKQLLTYNRLEDGGVVQIWNTDIIIPNVVENIKFKFTCVKNWEWLDIFKSDEVDLRNIIEFPFPDSIHLLLSNRYDERGNGFYLFNMDTRELKQIDVPSFSQYERFIVDHILPDGQLIAYTKKQIENTFMQLYDLNESKFYREAKALVKQSQLLSRCFLNNNLPKDLVNYIGLFSHRLTTDAVKEVTRKLTDKQEREQEESRLSTVSSNK